MTAIFDTPNDNSTGLLTPPRAAVCGSNSKHYMKTCMFPAITATNNALPQRIAELEPIQSTTPSTTSFLQVFGVPVDTGCLIHTVEDGQTLAGIAVKYDIEVCIHVLLFPLPPLLMIFTCLTSTNFNLYNQSQPILLQRINRLLNNDDVYFRSNLVVPLKYSCECALETAKRSFQSLSLVNSEDLGESQATSFKPLPISRTSSCKFATRAPFPACIHCGQYKPEAKTTSCGKVLCLTTNEYLSISKQTSKHLHIMEALPQHSWPLSPAKSSSPQSTTKSLFGELPSPTTTCRSRFDNKLSQIDAEIANAMSAWKNVTSAASPIVAPFDSPDTTRDMPIDLVLPKLAQSSRSLSTKWIKSRVEVLNKDDIKSNCVREFELCAFRPRSATSRTESDKKKSILSRSAVAIHPAPIKSSDQDILSTNYANVHLSVSV